MLALLQTPISTSHPCDLRLNLLFSSIVNELIWLGLQYSFSLLNRTKYTVIFIKKEGAVKTRKYVGR